MKKDFLQPKIEFIFLNDITVLTSSPDNVVDFPEDPNKRDVNNNLYL